MKPQTNASLNSRLSRKDFVLIARTEQKTCRSDHKVTFNQIGIVTSSAKKKNKERDENLPSNWQKWGPEPEETIDRLHPGSVHGIFRPTSSVHGKRDLILWADEKTSKRLEREMKSLNTWSDEISAIVFSSRRSSTCLSSKKRSSAWRRYVSEWFHHKVKKRQKESKRKLTEARVWWGDGEQMGPVDDEMTKIITKTVTLLGRERKTRMETKLRLEDM